MTMQKRIVLHFPKNKVGEPVIYRLVKDFDLQFNLLKAEVNPKEEGLLVLELTGDDENYKKGMKFLKEVGLTVQPLSQDVSMNKEKCVDCGLCVSLCPSNALIKDENSEVQFLADKCIACGICIKSCPYGAMTIEL